METDDLKSIVIEIEAINDEIKDANNRKAAVFASAKASGLDPNAIKELIRRRQKDRDALEELEALVRLYENHLEA